MLGNGRLEAKCQDGETRLGQIRGQMRKKVSLSLDLRGRGAGGTVVGVCGEVAMQLESWEVKRPVTGTGE